jgi:hypothetical protein
MKINECADPIAHQGITQRRVFHFLGWNTAHGNNINGKKLQFCAETHIALPISKMISALICKWKIIFPIPI